MEQGEGFAIEEHLEISIEQRDMQENVEISIKERYGVVETSMETDHLSLSIADTIAETHVAEIAQVGKPTAVNNRLEVSVNQRLDALPGQPDDMELFTIFRLPSFFDRDGNKSLYEPGAVSIGPYYRGRENLQVMEEQKPRYLRDFLARNDEVCAEVCIQKLRELEPRARQCYCESVSLSTDEFVEMLLLDGSFILELSFKCDDSKFDKMCRPGFLLEPVWMDLLLFENQIPFFVIENLFAVINGPNHATGCSNPLDLLDNLLTIQPMLGSCQELRGGIHHMLHLYHERYVPRPGSDSRFPGQSKQSNSGEKGVISCATQLHEASVKFREKKNPRDMFDITFKNGVMEIPTLKIYTNHKPLYANLLAFNMYTNIPSARTLTSYIVLLDCLVNTKNDVEILEKYGVIENVLSNEEELAIYLNYLGNCTYLDYEHHYFVNLFQDINSYSNLTWNKYRAKLIHDYFSNPWAAVSVGAATVLLVLTAVQAFYPLSHTS